MPDASPLAPVIAGSAQDTAQSEEEKAAPWIVRKIVGSMTGRIVLSSYETLRAAGTNIICLSPWGDSSPLFLPCIRVRDLAVHTIIVATGGMAAVAAPVMGPVSDIVVGSLGGGILVELGLNAGFGLGTKVANDLVLNKPINYILPVHSSRLETTAVKVLLITLKYKHTMTDAALGFYRSSLNSNPSLFATVKDYIAVEKGWFSPYLFASGRRPIIPRNISPDIVFCHGPFLTGDYSIGETLLSESASVIALCAAPSAEPGPTNEPEPSTLSELRKNLSELHVPTLSTVLNRICSRSPSPGPDTREKADSGSEKDAGPQPAVQQPKPRRLLVTVLGLKPHRGGVWTSSARPGESVMHYILLNGCPTLVVPARSGAPIVAWDGRTLEQLWEVPLPSVDGEQSADGRFEGVVDTLFEYLDLCVEWERVVVGTQPGTSDGAGAGADNVAPVLTMGGEDQKKVATANTDLGGYARERKALKDAITLLVAAAIRSKDSKDAKRELDADRSGIAMWRIP